MLGYQNKVKKKNGTLNHTCLAIVVFLDHYGLCSHVYHGNLGWVEARVALLVITSNAKEAGFCAFILESDDFKVLEPILSRAHSLDWLVALMILSH